MTGPNGIDEILRARLTRVFGFVVPPRPLSSQTPHALRLDLGGEVSALRPIQRFLSAFRRASHVARVAFDDSRFLSLLVVTYGDEKKPTRALRQFSVAGIAARDFRHVSALRPDDEWETWRHLYVAHPLALDLVEEVLWLAVASELRIRPRASQLDIYLVDLDAGLVLHPYDDRGLDLASTSGEAIASIRARLDFANDI